MGADAPTTTLEHVVDIDASPQTVFEMGTTADGRAAGAGRAAAVDARPGGEIRVVVDDTHVMSGRFVTVDPPGEVVFTFGWEGGELAPGDSTVSVTIAATETGSRMVLRHDGLPLDLVGSHAAGWTHFLSILAS